MVSHFNGGTYFPSEQWMSILTLVAGEYKTNREQLVNAADSIEKGTQTYRVKMLESEGSSYTLADLKSSLTKTSSRFDLVNGGILGAPKFPMPVLYRYHPVLVIPDE